MSTTTSENSSNAKLAPPPPLPGNQNSSSFDDLGKEEIPVEINWSREQDNRLRSLRTQLDRDGALPAELEQEYLSLEKKFDVFEREGMRRLMQGMTPEQHAAATGSPATASGAAAASATNGKKSGSASIFSTASDFFGKTANFVSESASKMKPHVQEAGRGAWFWSSLAVGAGAPGFIGRKLGLTDRFDHWNWIVPYVSTNRSGGLILGAIPVMTEVMGSGNHLKALREEARQYGTEMGMVVSIVLPSELDGFGIGVVKFAHHDDWKREFGQDFRCRLLPIEDNTANGFSYDLVMTTLTEMNEVMVTGKCVYVHCAKGVGRSLTLTVCYLIVFLGKNPDEAIAHAKACRHQISPNKVQMDFIRSFYAMHKHYLDHEDEERRKKYKTLPTVDLNALLKEHQENEQDQRQQKQQEQEQHVSESNLTTQQQHHQENATAAAIASIDTSPTHHGHHNNHREEEEEQKQQEETENVANEEESKKNENEDKNENDDQVQTQQQQDDDEESKQEEKYEEEETNKKPEYSAAPTLDDVFGSK